MSRFLRSITAIITLVLLSNTTAHADSIELSVDRYYSPYMGANLMISGLRAYQVADDIFLSGTQGDTSLCMTLGRTTKLLAEWSLSSLAMVTQHEIFGHGARAREFHLSNIGYGVNFFHGYTRASSAGINNLNVSQRAALAAGGMEATSILAGKLQNAWLDGDSIDHREAIFYLVNSLDQSRYVFSTSARNGKFSADNDVVSYIAQVNAWQGQGGQLFNLTNLKRKIRWDYFDPMLYYSIYSLYNYIFYGETRTNFSTLHIKSLKFMPTTRTLLTPWGPELQLLNHLHTVDNDYIGVYLRTGRTGGKISHGADLILKPIAKYNDWSIDNKLSVWHQPHIVKNTTAINTSNKYGFADFIAVNYKFSLPISAMAEIGYKTSGYLPGTPLSRGLVWRFGLMLKYAC